MDLTPPALRDRVWRWHSRLYHRLAPIYRGELPSSPDVGIAAEVHGEGGCAYAIDPAAIGSQSVAYSFGVGAEISFDLALIERYGVELHAFDPTEQAAAFVNARTLPASFHFHQWALAENDGPAPFHTLGRASEAYRPGTLLAPRHAGGEPIKVEGYRLETIMEKLGHSHVDLLKLDVEGAEFALIEGLGDAPWPVDQIVLELHPHIANLERGRLMIGRHGWRRTAAAIDALRARGYALFWVSERGTEFSFVRCAESRAG